MNIGEEIVDEFCSLAIAPGFFVFGDEFKAVFLEQLFHLGRAEIGVAGEFSENAGVEREGEPGVEGAFRKVRGAGGDFGECDPHGNECGEAFDVGREEGRALEAGREHVGFHVMAEVEFGAVQEADEQRGQEGVGGSRVGGRKTVLHGSHGRQGFRRE